MVINMIDRLDCELLLPIRYSVLAGYGNFFMNCFYGLIIQQKWLRFITQQWMIKVYGLPEMLITFDALC